MDSRLIMCKLLKQILYADDITIFVRDTESFNNLDKLLVRFTRISGLKMNKDKTFILLLGPHPTINTVFPFGKVVEIIKVLGIYFCMDPQSQERVNYKEILSKIKKLLTWWKQRDLTLMGKVQLVKTFVISKLIYVSSLTPVPLWAFEEINNLIFEFLWKGKDKIKRAVIILNYNKGGLKMPDFKLFIRTQRIMWAKRLLLGESNMKWKRYFKFLTRKAGGLLIFFSNTTLNLLDLSLPAFSLNMLEVWFCTKEFLCVKEISRRNEIFFNNRYIRINGRQLFSENLFLKNLYKFHHIVDKKGNIKSSRDFQRMGLDQSEIKEIKQIFENLPVPWKNLLNKNEYPNEDTELNLEFLLNMNKYSLCNITKITKDISSSAEY